MTCSIVWNDRLFLSGSHSGWAARFWISAARKAGSRARVAKRRGNSRRSAGSAVSQGAERGIGGSRRAGEQAAAAAMLIALKAKTK